MTSKPSRASALPYMGLILGSRLLLLLLLGWATGGKELSNDTAMHMGMVRHPLSVMLYTVPSYEQNPPLLPFLETIVGYPLQLFVSDFLALRLVMVLYETMLGGVFYELLVRLGLSERRRRNCLAAYLLLPMGWMTSVVMAQDEVIAAVAFVLPLLLFMRGRQGTAILLCGIGVIAAKLFIGLELLVLLVLSDRRRLPLHVIVGFAPIMGVYGAMSLHRLMHGLPLPLAGFRPDPSYGANFWIPLKTYAGVDLRAIGPYTGLLALGGALIPAAIVNWRRSATAADVMTVAITVNTSLLIFLTLFYHVESEYFIMVLPLLLAAACDAIDALSCLLVATIPWATKFFQNAEFMAQAGTHGGKAVAQHYFEVIFHSPPAYWLAASQVSFSILCLFLAVRWCWRLANRGLTISGGALSPMP